MKNREKYRGEIVEAIKEYNDDNEKMCCFLKNNVIPRFMSEEDMNLSICGGIDCDDTCAKMFAFWLEEEYTEPPKPEVDWSKVTVDTLVRVRDREDQEWILRYFKGINENPLSRYEAWESGATSITANGKYLCWNYCELVEEEDDEE